MADQAEVSRIFLEVWGTPESQISIEHAAAQVEYTTGPDGIVVGQILAQIEIHDATTVDHITINNGTIISGDAKTTQVQDGSEFVVQEVASTPGLSFDFKFSGVNSENPKVIHFHAWYDSNPGTSVKLQIKKNGVTWEDVIGALFPGIDALSSYTWNLPTPITDYVYDSLLELRVLNSAAGNTERSFHVDQIQLSNATNAGGGGLGLARSLSL